MSLDEALYAIDHPGVSRAARATILREFRQLRARVAELEAERTALSRALSDVTADRDQRAWEQGS